MVFKTTTTTVINCDYPLRLGLYCSILISIVVLVAGMCFVSMYLCPVCAIYWFLCAFALCVGVCVSLCVQECALFVNASLACMCVCACECACTPVNLSVRVAVLALYDRVWITRSSGAIKPRAVRQDGSWNDHREAVLLFPRQPSPWEAEELLSLCLQGPEG